MLDSLLPSATQLRLLSEATERYSVHLDLAGPFLTSRGISHKGAVAARLGVVRDPLPSHERFDGHLAISYITPGGTVAIKFRCIADHTCKDVGCQRYDQPAGQKVHLFNAGVLATTKADVVAVCEGELDAHLCTHELGIPAVGTAAGTWLDHYPRCFADFEEVIVIADHDVKPDGSSPGIKHAKRVQSTVSRSRIVTPPAGMDLGEWYLSAGAEVVKRSLGL